MSGGAPDLFSRRPKAAETDAGKNGVAPLYR